MTPLEKIIRRTIEADGPMPLDRYMALCLGHPVHGYYMTRDPFGRAGDFTTAPEVSQMFGELIGIWCAAQWQAMGAPAPFHLVELGPGRGTLMADALRAVRGVAGFREAARIALVEISPVLHRAQQQTLGRDATWYEGFADLPAGPMIVIANEFFDALPVRQLQRRDGRWFERCVGIGADGQLAIGLAPAVFDDAAEEGVVIEVSPLRATLAREIGARLAATTGAALIVDYGPSGSLREPSLQGVRAHHMVDILGAPGETDITSHVDFEALADAARSGGATVHGPMTQRDFLLAMGLEPRADALRRSDREQVDAAVERLAGPGQMGHLFKAMAMTSPGLAPPYPFGAA